MTKRILSFLLSLIMMVGVFSLAAFAEPTSYDLYVNGELITSEKLTVKCGEGTATYDPAEKTLTLNNAEITKSSFDAENYGIRAKSSDVLNIKLIGNNKIYLPENGGIMVNDDVNIYGDGKLAMEVLWDGIGAFGNVGIYEKAGLDIKTKDGVAISSEKRVHIDNSKVKAIGFNAGIDAATLDIENSEAVLEATENERNAVFISNENEITGYIKLVNSNVKAKSYYPALYAPGSIIFDGGEAECISTDDSSIFAKGDFVFGGGAKVNLEGKYPARCLGGFNMSAAEVIAKNTNQENFPAIDYEREITVFEDYYHFTYAMAEDSEETKIDLLARNETEFLNLYKNVHFKTEPIMLVYEIPFVKEVKLGGNTAPGKEIFELEIFDIGNGNAEAYKDVTVMAEVETNGAKKYMGKIVFSGPKDQFRELVCEGFYVREKNGGKAGWKYSDQAYHILMESGEDGDYSENIIQPVKAVMTPNGIFYEPFGEAVKEMNFVNIYTVNRDFTTIHIENPNRKPDEKNPNTGAEVSIAPAVLVPKKHR